MEGMVDPDPQFWSRRRVLLTGHTGFKGSWLSIWLRLLGAEVAGLSLAPPSDPSLYDLACRESAGSDSWEADIRDLERVTRIAQDFRPQAIIHLAAQSLVRLSYAEPVATFATNVMGTVHILEAARGLEGVESVLVVTSDKCYENQEWQWGYREIDPVGGRDPYSASKGCAELVTAAYRRSFHGDGRARTGVATARAGNVIGGGDWARDRLVPDCIRAFRGGRPVEIRHPEATRPWQHVLDPLCGYLLLCEALASYPGRFSEAWNFGPRDEDARPVGHLVRRIAEFWGEGATSTSVPSSAEGEATYLKVDTSKSRSRLPWRTRLDIDEALSWTTEWYRRQADGEAAAELCLEQIERYHALSGPP